MELSKDISIRGIKRQQGTSVVALLIVAVIAGLVMTASKDAAAEEASPTAYDVMLELKTAAENECAKNGPSCKAFTDIQRQLGEYIEASCRALTLTSSECAQSPLNALLNQPSPRVVPNTVDENT